jgi:hypothetical protein
MPGYASGGSDSASGRVHSGQRRRKVWRQAGNGKITQQAMDALVALAGSGRQPASVGRMLMPAAGCRCPESGAGRHAAALRQGPAWQGEQWSGGSGTWIRCLGARNAKAP